MRTTGSPSTRSASCLASPTCTRPHRQTPPAPSVFRPPPGTRVKMEYYCNSTRMSSHFQLYICIAWKFNLLSTLGTRPAPWLPGWPASTSPSSPASTPPPPAAQVPGSFLRGFPQSALADPGSGGGPSGSYCLSANIINLGLVLSLFVMQHMPHMPQPQDN